MPDVRAARAPGRRVRVARVSCCYKERHAPEGSEGDMTVEFDLAGALQKISPREAIEKIRDAPALCAIAERGCEGKRKGAGNRMKFRPGASSTVRGSAGEGGVRGFAVACTTTTPGAATDEGRFDGQVRLSVEWVRHDLAATRRAPGTPRAEREKLLPACVEHLHLAVPRRCAVGQSRPRAGTSVSWPQHLPGAGAPRVRSIDDCQLADAAGPRDHRCGRPHAVAGDGFMYTSVDREGRGSTFAIAPSMRARSAGFLSQIPPSPGPRQRTPRCCSRARPWDASGLQWSAIQPPVEAA